MNETEVQAKMYDTHKGHHSFANVWRRPWGHLVTVLGPSSRRFGWSWGRAQPSWAHRWVC